MKSPARTSRPAAAAALAALSLAGAFAASCVSRPGPAREVAVVRRGRERTSVPYRERARDAKAALLARINADRLATGAPPVAVDLVAARAGDDFCLDAARQRTLGHWDLAGRAPYDRYADAGGVDVHAENFSGTSKTGAPFHPDELVALLLDAHRQMMAERPPADGHRRTILDPSWTHVGIGVALEGGEFRMTEEFSRHAVEWVEIPAGPVSLAARTAPFAAELPKGWNLAAIEIAHERAPRPMSAAEIGRRLSYAYPATSRRLLPRLAASYRYPDGSTGEVDVQGGVVRARIPLGSGPGSYWVFVYAAPGPVAGVTLGPVTAARIVATP